jgi:phage/plasmid primase-like uncharacterized protein
MQARELAERLGLERSGRSWRGTCPACDYPRAFAVRPSKSDAALIFCANGCRHADLRAVIESRGACILPKTRTPPSAATERRRRQGAALRLAEGAVPAAGTLADIYLTGRALPGLAESPALRFRHDTPHPDGGKLPALVAIVTDAEGRAIAVHRTFLARDGRGKASVVPDRASLGPVWGGAIRLAEATADGTLLVGEGIETAASAGQLIGLPAWAAISAGNLARGLILPPGIRRVVIAVDPDPPGEAAAREAADRWRGVGLGVQFARPTSPGDFNDLLRARTESNAG